MATYKNLKYFRMNEYGQTLARHYINELICSLSSFAEKSYYDIDQLESICGEYLNYYKIISQDYAITSDQEDGEFVFSDSGKLASDLIDFFLVWILPKDYPLSKEDMLNILMCKSDAIPVESTRNLAYTLDFLANKGLISGRWMEIADYNGMFISKSGNPITSRVIANSLAQIKNIRPPKREDHERTKTTFQKYIKMQEELKIIASENL